MAFLNFCTLYFVSFINENQSTIPGGQGMY